MTKKELLIAWSFFISLFLAFSCLLYLYQMTNSYGDTTFAAQILYNIKHGKYSLSSDFGESFSESFKTIFYRSADYVCRLPLVATNLERPLGHYYFVIILLAPFTFFFDINVLIASSQAFIYISVLVFAYFFARDKKVNIITAILLTILFSQHPLWRQGLFGQFYFNRFFIPFSALVIWQMTRKKINYFWLTIASILALSTNEIYGIVLAMIFSGYAIFFTQKNKKPLFILAIVSLLYSLISIMVINSTYGPASTQTSFLRSTFSLNPITVAMNLFNNAWSDKSLVFLIVNFVFLGIWTITRLSTFVLTILFLLPNLIINIGGADKTGWSTHYHTGYFVPLIWMAIYGFTSLKKFHPPIKTVLLVFLIIITAFINTDNLSFRPKPSLALKNTFNIFYYQWRHKENTLSFRQRLRKAVGDGKSVSAPEAIVYNLIDHNIYYYPLNIDLVDKVIFRYYPEKSGDEKFVSVNYGQQDDNLDKCIRIRMKKNGFDFTQPQIVDGWAVIGRQKQ